MRTSARSGLHEGRPFPCLVARNKARRATCTTGGNDEVKWTPRNAKAIPSLVKWTGSKRSQASSIAKLMPTYRRYFEPFLGGGALLYLAARPGSVGGDIYRPLIDLWQMVQREPGAVVDDYAKQWKSLQNNLPDYYYVVRDRFNENPTPLDLSFLMRTCVNGIVRFNEDGGFNNSFHLSRKGMEPARFKAIVHAWHKAIQGVRFVCQDYAETISEAEKGGLRLFRPALCRKQTALHGRPGFGSLL